MLERYGNDVCFSSCEQQDQVIDKIDEFDIIGVAFPIHTSKSPVIFEEFIKKMPLTKDKKLFGIVTSGYIAGDVLHHYYEIRKESY